MLLHDYHLHTNFSCDSQAKMSAMCRAALNASIPEIGFTEHFDLHPEDSCKGFYNPDLWWQEITRCRDEYQSVLTIRAGIEISEPHQHSEVVTELLDKYPWDYALGALHWVGDQMIFDDAYFSQTESEAYSNYFSELQKMVDVGNFDIIAHMDIVKRYGYENYGTFDPTEYEAQIRSILKSAATKNIALEVNTATLRRSIKETSPSKLLLEWFRSEGGKWITLGSDAHSPENVGAGIHQSLTAIRDIGFEYVASYSRRHPSPTT